LTRTQEKFKFSEVMDTIRISRARQMNNKKMHVVEAASVTARDTFVAT
jgi:hypothetical protein